MRVSFLVLILVSFHSCKLYQPLAFNSGSADNPVIAHRGAWKAQDLPENSIAALQQSILLDCAGSEFDVRMTADDVLIVTHDSDYQSLQVEENTFAQLSKVKLDNGESLPTLRDFIKAGMKNNITTGLVCEIKPSKSKKRGEHIAEKVIALVKELKAENYISSYISFDYNMLKKIIEIDPSAQTQYLDGKKSPAELAQDGITGMDYHMNVYKENPAWIQEAKDLNLTLNVWTVNTQEDLDLFLAYGFDFITTDEPEFLLKVMNTNHTNNGYQMVWNDEFNYSGKPDSTKWGYNYGFVANEEKQYYTDHQKNARVEDGNLIIEAHKEKIKNEQYQSEEFKHKSWMRYAAEIDTAQYTSARVVSAGKASWTYGRIEVRAKLPEGRGMWPAIWMLGDNQQNIGWPECGEIDIMEHVGYEPDTIHGTIHTKAYNHMKGTQKGKTIYIENPYDQYHIYAIDWSPQKLDFLLDGVVYNRIQNEQKTTAEWPFDENFYLILNVAVGGTWGGRQGIDDDIFPQQMLIDYVRVFQLK